MVSNRRPQLKTKMTHLKDCHFIGRDVRLLSFWKLLAQDNQGVGEFEI